jgi:primosomal protein N'
MPVARVIPSIRAPRRIAGFDYVVPEGMAVTAGDLVQVPFRNKQLTGVVAEVMDVAEQPDRPLKPVTSLVAGLRVSDRTIALLQSLAVRSLSSPASVLHAWIGALPKRLGEGAAKQRQSSLLPTKEAHLLANHRETVIETALAAKKEGKRVLILTPWTAGATEFGERLNAPALTSEAAVAARFKAWSGFLRGEHPILVATRIGAWLAGEADVVIVDEPENDDHKQDELAPRYDARWIAEEVHRLGASVMEIGLTPRLSLISTPPTIEIVPRVVDIHSADWSNVGGVQNRALLSIEEAIEEGRSAIIIQPIHGDRARLRCQDCGWTAACPRCGAGPTLDGTHLQCRRCGWKGDAFLACPSCGGARLSKSRPGRETTVRDLAANNLAAVRVVSLGEWNALPTSERTNAVVVLTDLSLLAGGVEDIRRRERLIIAFRRLADACVSANSTLVVQSDAQLSAEALPWLTSLGCTQALAREMNERETFNLPPATRLVKLIVRGPSTMAKGVAFTLRGRVTDGISVQGPFDVERLADSRMPRSVVQLIFPIGTPDTAIQALLDPVLSDDVLVDLDPVAFFE